MNRPIVLGFLMASQTLALLYIMKQNSIFDSMIYGAVKPNVNESGIARVDLRHLKDNVTSSQWIQYFPYIQNMVSRFENMDEFPPIKNTTSARYSFVTVDKGPTSLIFGGILKAEIQAADFNGNPKRYGGDFFRAVLYRSMEPLSGVSCEIQDHMNGTYAVSCPILWIGEARLYVWLIHPSESLVALMIATSGLREPGVSLKATVNSTITGKQELVECGFDFSDEFSATEICNHTNPRSGDPWFCVKTTSDECPPIEWMDRYYWSEEYDQRLGKKPLFKKGMNWRVVVRGSVRPFEIPNDHRSRGRYGYTDKLCNYTNFSPTPTDPATSTGWIEVHTLWRSFLCRNSIYNPVTLSICLRDHSVYLVGDSTVRQWYNYIIESMYGQDVGTDGPTIWAQARNGHVAKYNVTIHYRAHGPPLHNPGNMKMRPYIFDTIENIPGSSENTVLIFTIGLHMDLFHPDLYLQRIRNIKKAVIKLQTRAPKVKIFVKGHHVHAQTTRLCPSDWLSYRHDVLLRHTFANMTGVVYLPYWDLTSVFNNVPYHPQDNVLKVQIGILQSVLCQYRK